MSNLKTINQPETYWANMEAYTKQPKKKYRD